MCTGNHDGAEDVECPARYILREASDLIRAPSTLDPTTRQDMCCDLLATCGDSDGAGRETVAVSDEECDSTMTWLGLGHGYYNRSAADVPCQTGECHVGGSADWNNPHYSRSVHDATACCLSYGTCGEVSDADCGEGFVARANHTMQNDWSYNQHIRSTPCASNHCDPVGNAADKEACCIPAPAVCEAVNSTASLRESGYMVGREDHVWDWNYISYTIELRHDRLSEATTVPSLGRVDCAPGFVAQDPVTGAPTQPHATCADADGKRDDAFVFHGCTPKGTCSSGDFQCPPDTHVRIATFATAHGSGVHDCCEPRAPCSSFTCPAGTMPEPTGRALCAGATCISPETEYWTLRAAALDAALDACATNYHVDPEWCHWCAQCLLPICVYACDRQY